MRVQAQKVVAQLVKAKVISADLLNTFYNNDITGGNTTLYINRYYEKNLATGNATSYYYLAGRLVAMKQGSANVTYVHQGGVGWAK